MAFAMSRLRSCMNTYADAWGYFESCTPWRGDTPADERPLKERRVRHMGVRTNHLGDIIFRLHSTDVVTWHSDNRVTLDPYSSRSTDAFANGFTPYNMYCSFNSFAVSIRTAGPAAYRIYRADAQRMCFQVHDEGGDRQVLSLVSGHRPFEKLSVNRSRAMISRKLSGLQDFKMWLDAADAMSSPVTWDEYRAQGWMQDADMLKSLANPELWPRLRTATYNSKSSLLEKLDRMVLKECDCLDVQEVEYFTSWSQHAAMRNVNRKFGRYL